MDLDSSKGLDSNDDPYLSPEARSLLIPVGILTLKPTSTSSSTSTNSTSSYLPLSPNNVISISSIFNVHSARALPAEDFFISLALLLSSNLVRLSASPSALLQGLQQRSVLPLRLYLVTKQQTQLKAKKLPSWSQHDIDRWDEILVKQSEPLQKTEMDKACLKAALVDILDAVKVDRKAWNASSLDEKELGEGDYFFDEDKNQDSLLGIYNQLPSPSPDESLLISASTWTQELLTSTLISSGPPGLRSSLHVYQKRTLWSMLQRELVPQMVPDPHPVSLRSPHDGSSYYVDPKTLSFSLFNTFVRDVRGGVLCEGMGNGKTIESLALILSTLGMLPDLQDTEQSSLTTSLVTSEVAMTFPDDRFKGLDPAEAFFSQDLAAIPYTSRSGSINSDEAIASRTGSNVPDEVELPKLVDLCAHAIRTSSIPIDYVSFLSRESVPPNIKNLLASKATPFIHLWPPLPTRTSRVPIPRTPLRIYLSPATLVVVPLTLVKQWRTQIVEHCEEGSLRVLALENASDQIPSARELAENWDLILLSHPRFGKERAEGKLHRQWSTIPRKCRCPYLKATRIVNCSCPPTPQRGQAEISPLLQVRFKRLIVDEGDVLKGTSGLVDLACSIEVESRWIVSGTPTESLMSVSATQSCSEAFPSLEEADFKQEDAIPDQVDPPFVQPSRMWTNLERKDLDRLKKLFVSFLKLPHFYAPSGTQPQEVRDWSHTVSLPLVGSANKLPEWGACRRLSSIMRMMVRNKLEDVDKEVSLPNIYFKVARLNLGDMERLTFNSLNALIALNSVWTQREDEDYLFHSSNRVHLQGIMENIALACFHFGGPDLVSQLTEAADHARKQLLKKDKWNKSEREEAEEALARLEEALSCPEWLEKLQLGDVIYKAQDLDLQIMRSWTRKFLQEPKGLSGEELLRIRRALSKIVAEQSRNYSASGSSSSLDDEVLSEDLITAGARDFKLFQDSLSRISKKKKALEIVDEANVRGNSLLKGADGLRGKEIRKGKGVAAQDARLPTSSTLSRAKLVGVSSTKVKFLVDFVQSLPQGDKALVFSSFDNVLYELGNALELCSCHHFIIASGVAQKRRNEFIAAFSTPGSSARLLLMKTGLSAKGLDLHVASHVLFMDILFDSSLELQALKRAYRIGQKKEVFVTRMVMKDTFEDEMLKRRQELEEESSSSSTENQSQNRSAWNDERMRYFISHPQFLGREVSSSHENPLMATYAPLNSPVNVFLVSEDVEESSSERLSISSSSAPPEPKEVKIPPPTSQFASTPPSSPASQSIPSFSSILKRPASPLPLITPPDVPLTLQRPTSPSPQAVRHKKKVKFSDSL